MHIVDKFLFEHLFPTLLVIYLGKELVSSYDSSIFNLLESCQVLSIAAGPLYVPTRDEWDYQIFYIFANTYFLFPQYNQYRVYEVHLTVLLICTSTMTRHCASFPVLVGHDCYHFFFFFEKCLFKFFDHFFTGLFVLLLLSLGVMGVSPLTLIIYIICKYFI